MKRESDVFVGDFVEIEKEKHTNIITKLYNRHSLLSRPFVANVDLVIIFVSVIPSPDYNLIDKLIIDSVKNDIDSVIVVNKIDLDDGSVYQEIVNQYGDCQSIYKISAQERLFDNSLLEIMKGKLCALAGQSAVGKSTFINSLLEKEIKVGELSKVEKGKHTTRHIEIHSKNDYNIIDTCGFTSMDLDVDYRQLSRYYIDYMTYTNDCKYKNCTHTSEPDCVIKQMVEKGELSKDRYRRYVSLFNELYEKYKMNY